ILVPSEKIEVPSIVGKDIKEAAFILSDENLGLKVVGRKFSSQIPEDVIISQVPPPEAKVHRDRAIEVVISEGRRVVVIPSLVGKKVREANLDLSGGSGIDTISYLHSLEAEGEIMAQDPPAGSSSTRKEGLDILVSLGPRRPQFYMPDLTGKILGKGTNPLDKLVLDIGKIKEVPFAGEEGIILSQFPLPGSQVDAGALVEFTVSTSFYQEEELSPVATKLIATSVTVPWGITSKEVKFEIKDVQGTRTVSYGLRDPGEKVWLISEVTGTGEMRIYVGGKLVSIRRVKEGG
ncbi:unnamed protein product, partial [marine sediment metagenome]